MRVAVIGATGFIGHVLVHRLLAAGHQVRALVRSPELHFDTFPQEVELGHFDVIERPIRMILNGCDAVVNLAGEPVAQRWTDLAKARIRRSRVEGTIWVVHAMKEVDSVKTFVSASAVGYYGGTRGDEPLTEDSPAGDDFLASVCVEWEREALDAKKLGARVVLLRTGTVLHPEGGALKKLLPLYRLGVGGRLGSGRQMMSWISLEDQLGLILHALGTPAVQGPMNAVAPGAVSNAEFSATLGKVLGKPARLPAPGLAMKLVLGEMASMLLGGQRVIPKVAQQTGYKFVHPELEPALRAMLEARVVVASPR